MDMDFRSKTNGICWTTTPYSSEALKELPFIEMQGWEQTWSSVIGDINAWYERFNNIGEGGNPFAGLYVGARKSKYVLPYFNEYHHAVSQSWGAGQGPIGSSMQDLTKLAETVARVVLPAAGILFPQSYEGSNPGTYSFNFNLINTNAGDGGEISNNIKKNREFLESFIKDNLHNLNGCMSITPPLIYEIYIPGIRWSPAAVITSLNVNNKGTMNNNINGIIEKMPLNYIYPDAWEVSVGITELINETKSIYDDAVTNKAQAGDIIKTRVFPNE